MLDPIPPPGAIAPDSVPVPSSTPAPEPAPNGSAAPATNGSDTPMQAAALETPPAVEQTAPADPTVEWRAKMAGEDAGLAKQLDRYASLGDVGKKLRELQNKLSSEPRMPKAPGPEATAEDRVAYRKELGIPDEPTGYDVNVADGFTWGESDKPVLDSFLQFAHERDMPPDQVKKALSWYPEYTARLAQSVTAYDESTQQHMEATLHEEWGADFSRNMTAATNLSTTWGKQAKIDLLESRGPDGRKLKSNPGVLRELASLYLKHHPTVVPAGTADEGKYIDDELDTLTKQQGDHSSPYWRSDKADAMQKRWRELYDARENMKRKTG